jgi:hypothetical protein
MPRNVAALWGCFFLAACATGCNLDPTPLDTAHSLVLYSLDPKDYHPEKNPGSENHFHGCVILGKTELSDSAKRDEIVTAFKNGMAQSGIEPYECFEPRHAIRTVESGRTIDYVICFECCQFQVYTDGQRSEGYELVSREPQPVFDKVLKEAGIKLAPPPASADE